MPNGTVTWGVQGLKELDARLLNLPAKLQAKAIRSALSAGARVIRNDARSRIHNAVHWDASSHRSLEPGGLRDAIRFTTSVRTSSGNASARIFVSKMAWWGRLVHFGTLPHLIFGGKSARQLNRDVRHGIFGDSHKKANRFQIRTVESKVKALNILGHFVAKVDHPGARPKPFLEQASAAKSDAAVQAVADKLRAFFDTVSNY